MKPLMMRLTLYIFRAHLQTVIIADINPAKLKRVNFVLKDPTKIFINQMDWGRLRKRKFKVSVLKNIKVAAVTVNPTSPSGYSFDHKELRDTMQAALPDIPDY